MDDNASSWLEGTARLTSLGVATLLVFSVVYDASFLAALGLRFSEVPTSISDHIRSAIVWVPQFGLGIFAGIAYNLMLKRIEGGKSEDELVDSSPTPRFTRWFRWSADAMIPVTGIFIGLSSYVLQGQYFGLSIVVAVTWGLLALSIVRHKRMGQGFTRTTGFLFIMVPLLLAFVAGTGFSQGEGLLREKKAQWEITIADGDSRTQLRLTGLRRFEGVVVAVGEDMRVHLLPADRVVHALELDAPKYDKPPICRWFGVRCPSGR